MANENRTGFYYAYRETSGPAPIREFLTTSNVTLAKGDLVVMSNTGLVNIATATDSMLVGVAAHAVTGVAGVKAKVLVVVGLQDVVFLGRSSGTTAQADVGELVDFEGTTGIMEVNENAQSIGNLRVMALKPGDSLDSNCGVYVKITKCPFAGGAATVDAAG